DQSCPPQRPEPPRTPSFARKREDMSINPFPSLERQLTSNVTTPPKAPMGGSVPARIPPTEGPTACRHPYPLSFFERTYEHGGMATTDRQATTLALAHALSAAERGLAVIPLSRTKLPALRSPHRDDPATPNRCHRACRRLGHGVSEPPTEPVRIRRMSAAAPHATGYGIACGLPPHHLIGIDLDTKTGTDASAALREIALRHLFTIPATVVVRTPSGGRHLWLSRPPDLVVPNSASRLAPVSHVRGARGFLRGPGSRTAPGPRPAADPPAATPPAPPHALVGRRARPGPGAVRPRRPRGPAEHPPVLGRLPRLRGRHRSRPRGPPRPRGPRHRPVRTRGPRDDRLGGPPHRSHPLTCPDPAPRPPANPKTPMHHRSRVPTMSPARGGLTSRRGVDLLGPGLSEREARATIASAARLTGHTP